MVSLHVPVVTSRRCLALDEYFLSRTHPAHRDITRIEVQLVGCRTIYEFLAITDENWSKRGKGRVDPAVHIYGGSSYGANLTPQETQDWFAGLLESLQIGTAVTAAHFDDTHGRFDFHLLVPYYNPEGRPLKPARCSLRGFVREHICAMTERLNDRRLDAGNNLTIGNLNSAWMVYFKEREPKLEPLIEVAKPAVAPEQPIVETQKVAVVAPPVTAEPTAKTEGVALGGNSPAETSASRVDNKRASSATPEPAGQTVPEATSPGAVVRSVTGETAPKAESGPALEKKVPLVLPAGNPLAPPGLVGRPGRDRAYAQPAGSKQEAAKPVSQEIRPARAKISAISQACRDAVDAEEERKRKEKERAALWAKLTCVLIRLGLRDAKYADDFADLNREVIEYRAKLLEIYRRPVRREAGGDLADFLGPLMELDGDYTGDAVKTVGVLEEDKKGTLWRDLALLLIWLYQHHPTDRGRAERMEAAEKLCKQLLEAYAIAKPKDGQAEWLLLVMRIGEKVTGVAKDRGAKSQKQTLEARSLLKELTAVLWQLDKAANAQDKVKPLARACGLCANLHRLYHRNLPSGKSGDLPSLLTATMGLVRDYEIRDPKDFLEIVEKIMPPDKAKDGPGVVNSGSGRDK